jgi:hypothetical protein
LVLTLGLIPSLPARLGGSDSEAVQRHCALAGPASESESEFKSDRASGESASVSASESLAGSGRVRLRWQAAARPGPGAARAAASWQAKCPARRRAPGMHSG